MLRASTLQKSNLNQHIKAVHLEMKPFVCSFPSCGLRFSFKHVRDKHEKSGCHVFTPVSFLFKLIVLQSPSFNFHHACEVVHHLIISVHGLWFRGILQSRMNNFDLDLGVAEKGRSQSQNHICASVFFHLVNLIHQC